jgi:CTP synthase (UTP-ammonia lyase)
VITPLACSLVGKVERVRIVPDTRAAAIWGSATALEDFRCNYGVDSAYHPALSRAGLGLSGFGDGGELRIIELPQHPFFLATLFLPQLRSAPTRPHPIFLALARMAVSLRPPA